ncbi:MAG: amidase family protein, partial [Patescibacteria group bacterium]
MKDDLTIKEAKEMLAKKKIGVSELAEFYLNNIKEKDKEISAFLEVFGDTKEQSKKAQEKINADQADDLTGIPLAIKDNILIEGRSVSAGSKILEGYTAPYDSTVAKKLKKDDVVFMGRTNMDEFAMGGSTEKSAFMKTKNPRDTSRVPGGSSGGSAAAVAAGMVPAALGSDTGGSVRQPASFCGCVSLKPTYGAVSRFGLIAMGSSLDQIGPITKTVSDAEVLFNCISGKDDHDSTTYESRLLEKENKDKDKIIGVPWHLLEKEGVDKEVIEAFKENLLKLEKLGYKTKEIKLPYFEYTLSAYYILMPAEVSSNMARFDGMRYGAKSEGDSIGSEYMKTRALFGEEVKRRIITGTFVLSSGYYDTYYNKGYTVKRSTVSDLERVFYDEKEPIEAIAIPTT